jgi:hypothetical protein
VTEAALLFSWKRVAAGLLLLGLVQSDDDYDVLADGMR